MDYFIVFIAIGIAILIYRLSIEFMLQLISVRGGNEGYFQIFYALILILVAILGVYGSSSLSMRFYANNRDERIPISEPSLSFTELVSGNKSTSSNRVDTDATKVALLLLGTNATATEITRATREAEVIATSQSLETREAKNRVAADVLVTSEAHATATALAVSIAAQSFANTQATIQAQATSDAITKAFSNAQATEEARATATAAVVGIAAQSLANTQATIQAQATSDSITKAFSNAQATEEARATATAAAKATSDAIKDAFAESNQRPIYHTLSLRSIANKSTEEGYKSPPFGRIELARVLFDMPRGQNSATTQAEGLPDFPTTLTLFDINISHTKTVYLLITGGSTRNIFEGSTIGSVTFYFTNNQTYSQPIIPGWNIREWKDCCNSNVIHTNDPTVQEVWRSENNFDNGTATIDMWTIEIPENYRQQTLETIEITDRSTSAVGSKNPAINLLGMTVMSQE